MINVPATVRGDEAPETTRADSADRPPRSGGSWADRLTERLERGKIPVPFVAAGVWLALFALLIVSQWATGASLRDSIRPFQPVTAGLIVVFPWLVGAFNRAASRAIRRAAPLVDGGIDRVQELETRLIHAPGRVTLAVGLLVAIGVVTRVTLNPSIIEPLQVSTDPPALWVVLGVIVPLVAIGAAAYLVKVVHLAWGLHRITTRELRVDIWELGPLLSFAGVTSRMAASTLAIMLGAFLLSPRIYSDALGLAGALFAITLSGGVFVLPLLGLHARIVGARQDAETALARQMERAIERLRAADAANDLSVMDPINKEIGAVETAIRTVGRIQTWPWEPELFRWIVGALMFPIALFVIQYALSRVLPA